MRRSMSPALTMALFTLLALPACGTGRTGSDGSGTSASTESDSGIGGAPAPTPSSELADGRHPVYLTAVDTARGSVTFDLIQFLTGEEADKAWRKAHPGATGGVPDDYFVINDNAKLRTMPTTSDVVVKVLDLGGENGVSAKVMPLPALIGYAKGAGNPFWLTVAAGRIAAIDEQYVP
jgi:hypothetical protein